MEEKNEKNFTPQWGKNAEFWFRQGREHNSPSPKTIEIMGRIVNIQGQLQRRMLIHWIFLFFVVFLFLLQVIILLKVNDMQKDHRHFRTEFNQIQSDILEF